MREKQTSAMIPFPRAFRLDQLTLAVSLTGGQTQFLSLNFHLHTSPEWPIS